MIQVDARSAIPSFFPFRGCKSHKHDIDLQSVGSSSKPYTSVRMPAIWKVLTDNGAGLIEWEFNKGSIMRGKWGLQIHIGEQEDF